MLNTLLKRIRQDKTKKPTGVTCEYCGWNGDKDDLFKAKRLNQDGSLYEIDACPHCYRNGGLIYYGP